jgi:membrane protein involved in colicin uptake
MEAMQAELAKAKEQANKAEEQAKADREAKLKAEEHANKAEEQAKADREAKLKAEARCEALGKLHQDLVRLNQFLAERATLHASKHKVSCRQTAFCGL